MTDESKPVYSQPGVPLTELDKAVEPKWGEERAAEKSVQPVSSVVQEATQRDRDSDLTPTPLTFVDKGAPAFMDTAKLSQFESNLKSMEDTLPNLTSENLVKLYPTRRTLIEFRKTVENILAIKARREIEIAKGIAIDVRANKVMASFYDEYEKALHTLSYEDEK